MLSLRTQTDSTHRLLLHIDHATTSRDYSLLLCALMAREHCVVGALGVSEVFPGPPPVYVMLRGTEGLVFFRMVHKRHAGVHWGYTKGIPGVGEVEGHGGVGVVHDGAGVAGVEDKAGGEGDTVLQREVHRLGRGVPQALREVGLARHVHHVLLVCAGGCACTGWEKGEQEKRAREELNC